MKEVAVRVVKVVATLAVLYVRRGLKAVGLMKEAVGAEYPVREEELEEEALSLERAEEFQEQRREIFEVAKKRENFEREEDEFSL